MKLDDLKNNFLELYGESIEDIRIFYSPGRVNLIGDHTDYNGGLVFPCGVNRGTTLLVRKNQSDKLALSSLNFEPPYNGGLGPWHATRQWTDYPLGVFDQFKKKEASLSGLDMLFYGDLPQGAGLSSSASIEVVTAFAINRILGCDFKLLDLVKMSQAAERNFVGVSCGIMDQFAVAFANKDCAIRLDCHSLEYEQVPLPLESHCLVITNSNTERQLTDSAYNQRAQECQDSLDYFSKALGVEALAALSIDEFNDYKQGLPSEMLVRRTRHVVTEHHRVIQGVAALKSGNLELFGQLMCDSHKSLRDDYQVSTESLDFLVDSAMKVPGTLGSRLTGAGFGGCTVSLVAKEQVDQFCNLVGTSYQQAFNRQADFYQTSAAGGVREL